jgi:dihydroflavonol-4-reductase
MRTILCYGDSNTWGYDPRTGGRYDHKTRWPMVLKKILNGEMPAGIQGSFNLCDVRDLANGCILAADRGAKGECYILGNKEVTFKDFCSMFSKESGCKPVRFYLPLGLASFFAGIMEKQAKRTGKKPLLTTFSIYNLARNNSFDSSKAANQLGYKTRSFEETIRDEVVWLKSIGKISTPPVWAQAA